MAFDTAVFLVTPEIAVRSGVIEGRYSTADGRFVLNRKDLSKIRFATDEYINGLKGVEKVSREEADALIARNGFKTGTAGDLADVMAALSNDTGEEEDAGEGTEDDNKEKEDEE